MEEMKSILLIADGIPTVNLEVSKRTTIGNIKNLLVSLKYDLRNAIFIVNENKKTDVFHTDKYDTLTLASIWKELQNPQILINKTNIVNNKKLENIPKDVLAQIALELNLEDIVRLCQTNKKFDNIICKSDSFWINKSKKDFPELDLEDGGLYLRIKDDIHITGEEIKQFRDMKRFQNLLLNVLDYLHYLYSDTEEERDKYFINIESDSNLTEFEILNNNEQLGVKSKKPLEARFIMNLLRLKIDENAYPLLGELDNEKYESGKDDLTLSIKKLATLFSEINEYDALLKPSQGMDVWDYHRIRKWLKEEFLKGKYSGLGVPEVRRRRKK